MPKRNAGTANAPPPADSIENGSLPGVAGCTPPCFAPAGSAKDGSRWAGSTKGGSRRADSTKDGSRRAGSAKDGSRWAGSTKDGSRWADSTKNGSRWAGSTKNGSRSGPPQRSPTARRTASGRGREEREVVVEIEALSDLAPGHRGVRRSRGHRLDERVAGGRDAVEPVPRGGHRAQQLDGPGRGVQSHAVADPPVAVRIVREHDADAPLAHRRRREVDPGARQIRGELHPVGARRIRHHRAFGQRVEPGLGLERHRAGEDASIDLGQRHVHRDVARGQPLRPARPALLVTAREHHLKHGPAARIERRRPAFRPRRGHREAGGVQHYPRLRQLQHPLDEVRRSRVLQARDVERKRIHPARAEGARQRVDGGEVGRLHVGAVEHDGRGGRAVDPPRHEVVEAAGPEARPVEAGPRQRGGLAPFDRVADEVGREGEQVARIRRPAMHAVLPQAVGGLRRYGAERGERRVRLVVAGKERERNGRSPAGLGELLDPVGPVAGAPEHPRDDELRLRDDRIDVEVHRHRMGELHEVGEPQRGEAVAEAGARASEAGQLGVRGGEEDDVAGGLSEIDGFGLVDRRAGSGLEEVHREGSGFYPKVVITSTIAQSDSSGCICSFKDGFSRSLLRRA